jgi:hypothetical protein
MVEADNLRARPGLVEPVRIGRMSQLDDLRKIAVALLNLVIILV